MKKNLTNRITIQTESCYKNPISIGCAVFSFIKQQTNIDKETLENMKNATIEAVTNSIVFAYPDKPGKVSICVSIFDDQILEIKVQDWGCGIKDVKKAKEALYTTSNETEHAGLGFAVMESFSDKLTVKSIPRIRRGTIVTMQFNLK